MSERLIDYGGGLYRVDDAPRKRRCRWFGCDWERMGIVVEDVPMEWHRVLWHCRRCHDERKVFHERGPLRCYQP